MYQIHYTLDQNKINKEQAIHLIGSPTVKILEHYNITLNGIKHYELLTKENVKNLIERTDEPKHTIRYKIETFEEPKDFKYVERHYKFDKKPPKQIFRALNNNIMLAKVVNPTAHKYIVTLRATSTKVIKDLHSRLESLKYREYTEEFCIEDTNEELDYLHN